MGLILEAFPPEVNLPGGSVVHPRKASTLCTFADMLHRLLRNTESHSEAPQHRHRLVSTLIGNRLPVIRRQIQNSVAGPGGPSLSAIIHTASRFFANSLQGSGRKKELKSAVLAWQAESLEKQKLALGVTQSPPVSLANCTAYVGQDHGGHCRSQGQGAPGGLRR